MKLNETFEKLLELLRSPHPDYPQFRSWFLSHQQSLVGKDAICCAMIMRLILALEGMEEKQTGPADALTLFRQVIRAYERRIEVNHILWRDLQGNEQDFGLRVTGKPASDLIELMADPWHPLWLPDVERIDYLEQRRSDNPIIGDGLINAMSSGKFTTYQSEAQKVAVQECLFAPPGATLLITLPTGAGKSLCIQLPAWQESRGGRIKGGTTLVVVPTVSLALDQEQRTQQAFFNAFGQDFKPSSLTGATSETVRAAIYKGLEQGTLPILYTSPEALMNSSLYQASLEAARNGFINRLVIDEAHLIETWGAGFRTEFQFLSAYHKKLLAVTKGQLRTILLSATISDSCEDLLKKMFSTQDSFYSIRADRLRPEIAYWFDRTENDCTRQEHVLEALRHLPRPAIIYVTAPDDTKKWLEIIKAQGFKRIATFSGETNSDDRLRLVKAWNANEYDVMIATSAFGVGIDKSDVRTVIHACLPENIDRFYQEVGRVGRDGFSAISLLCLTNSDYSKARQMNRTARITTLKAIPRWEGMQQTKRLLAERSNAVLIDTNATPSENKEMYKGPSNREWNEHTLLLLQRAGLITITDMRDESTLAEPDMIDTNSTASEDSPTWLQVELLYPQITNYPRNRDFSELFEKTRQVEVAHIQKQLNDMLALASEYTNGSAKRCLAHQFAKTYPRSSLACGGCPVCRHTKQRPYTSKLELEREGGEFTILSQPIQSSALTDFIGPRNRIHITLDEPCDASRLQTIGPLLPLLVTMGFQQVILPDELTENQIWMNELLKKLTNCIQIPHILLDEQWITHSEPRPVYSLPTIIVYPLQDWRADRVHQAFRRYTAKKLAKVPVVAVIRRNLFLVSENGMFVERINGLSYNIEHLQEKLHNPLDLVF